MIFAKVNDMKVSARIGTSILDACSLTGVSVPRFCYHEILSISGNCRMCLVEVEGLDKPIASCLSQIYNDISVYTDSPFVKKARENVLETLLINHPLDCPICDQAGECDLQDQSELFGGDTSRFSFNKRSVEDKYCGPFIKTIMTRCIHCTRCVRYASEIGGIRSFGTLSRGVSTEIGGYLSHVFKSEISGNVIDLCPVGALNLKPNAFKSRSWELRCSESIDTSDCLGSNIYVHSKESSIFRILPKVNSKINGSIISDKARFLYDSPKKKSNKIPPFLHCKKYKKVQKFKFLGWYELHRYLKSATSRRVCIILDASTDLATMLLIKRITFHKPWISLRYIDADANPSNFYSFNTFNNVESLDGCDFCFILSVDLKVECAVLNVRLRTRFNNSLLPISSCGIPFESDLPVNFVNISPKCVLNVFEGKDKSICSSLLYSKNTCVIFGESFSNRISNVFLFFEYFRHFFRNISVLRVSGYLNSSAPSFANIKALAPKDLRKHYHYFCINLKDTHFLRKRLKRFIGTGLIRFNGEGSCISARLAMIVPTTIRHLTSSMYLNMENRVQRTTEEYKNCFEGHSIKSTFLRLYSSITGKKADARTHTRVLYEMLSDPSLFDHMPKGRSFGHNFSFMNKFRFFKYMDKPGPGDIYCSDGSIKDSRNMQDCVRWRRDDFSNFF